MSSSHNSANHYGLIPASVFVVGKFIDTNFPFSVAFTVSPNNRVVSYPRPLTSINLYIPLISHYVLSSSLVNLQEFSEGLLVLLCFIWFGLVWF